MALSLTTLDDVKRSFEESVSRLPSFQQRSAKIAWNAVIDTAALSISQQKIALTIKKNLDTIAATRRNLGLASLSSSVTNASNMVKNPMQKALSGFKSTAIDNLKKTVNQISRKDSKKSVFSQNMVVKSAANILAIDKKIEDLTNNLTSLNRLKFDI